jgi:hypothetical protein
MFVFYILKQLQSGSGNCFFSIWYNFIIHYRFFLFAVARYLYISTCVPYRLLMSLQVIDKAPPPQYLQGI